MLRIRLSANGGNMHRHYRRYDQEALTKAYMDVKEKKMPVKKAARLHSVPETTLRQRVIGEVDIDTVKSGPNPLFSLEHEARLVDHISLLAKVGYGYTRSDVCNLATDYAVDIGLRQKDSPLSLQWYRNFISRWPNLAVKKPRSLAIARAKSTSREKVTAYFEELEKIINTYNLKEKPQYIYNIDETGISDNHTPPFVVADKKSKPVAITSGMSYNVTVLSAGNALGSSIPTYFIFPGKRMRNELLEGATTGVSGTVSETGWSNGQVFRKYLEEHFISYVQGRDPSQPLLLLYDGHRSHVSLAVIDWAKQHNIILFVLPPHTSHVLQPLDVGCFGPFQKIYNNERAKFIREMSSSSVPKHAICDIACRAYNLSVSGTNLRSSFKKCGIYPFNPSAIDCASFIPATVFQHESNDSDSNEVTNHTISPQNNECFIPNEDKAVGCHALSPSSRAAGFFSKKESVLLDKSKNTTKKRKVLTAIVGGKPIPEDSIVQEIIGHLEMQSSKKQRKMRKTEKHTSLRNLHYLRAQKSQGKK